jgi:hypothetical protein
VYKAFARGVSEPVALKIISNYHFTQQGKSTEQAVLQKLEEASDRPDVAQLLGKMRWPFPIYLGHLERRDLSDAPDAEHSSGKKWTLVTTPIGMLSTTKSDYCACRSRAAVLRSLLIRTVPQSLLQPR